jgi:hypothetical protein
LRQIEFPGYEVIKNTDYLSFSDNNGNSVIVKTIHGIRDFHGTDYDLVYLNDVERRKMIKYLFLAEMNQQKRFRNINHKRVRDE